MKNIFQKVFSMLVMLSVMLIGLPTNVVMASAFNDLNPVTVERSGDNALTNDTAEPAEYDSTIFASGSGTAQDPYMICTEAQLRDFAESMTKSLDYKGKYVQLKNDIAISSAQWTPIGEGEYAFAGTFDGGGYSVTNLTIGSKETPHQDKGEVFYGLFGVVGADASIRNLHLDVNIYAQSDASIYVGGLAGYAEGASIDGVTVSGTVWGRSGMKKSAANHFSGGIAGMALRAVVTNCVNHADIYGEAYGGAGEAGGILGLGNRTLIANCVSNGRIQGTADRKLEGMSAVGGIAGVHAGTMVNCVALGETCSLTYSQHVGVLAGWVTGVGELYHNFYSLDAGQTIEQKAVNPAVSVGWLVGPGENDEGEAYQGGVEYHSTGLTGEKLQADAVAAELNKTFETFPVDMADYGSVPLKQWKNAEGNVLPAGEETKAIYVKPDIQEAAKPEASVSGVFYGRSEDGSFLVRLTVEDHVVKKAEEVKNTTGKNASQVLDAVVKANGAGGITQEDAFSAAVKSAVETAFAHMEKKDTTGYGKADGSIFAGGSGTEKNPYQIASQEQLRAFADSLNTDESYEGVYLELTKDIVLTGQWKPAGTDSHYPFKGTLDGNGHTITGLQIGTEEAAADIQYAGLFAYIEGGTVVDLILDSPYIHTVKTDNTRLYAGTLASFVDQSGEKGYFDRCRVVNGRICVESASGAGYAGGLFGSAQYGTITNATVHADVSAKSTGAWTYAGVMAGTFARMGAINNAVTGTVNADAPLNKAAIGGLAGFHSGASYNNVADVALTSVGTTGDVGAFAGRNTGIGMMLSGCFNSEREQKAGDSVNTSAGVGSIVAGEREGKGAVEGMNGMAAAKLNARETVDTLNGNKGAGKEGLRRVQTLLSGSWKVAYPEKVTLLDWESGSAMPVLSYGDFAEKETDSEKAKTVPAKAVIKSVKNKKGRKAVIKWKKVKGASGYVVYRSTSKKGKYKAIKRVKSQKKICFTNTKLKKRTYYYKVRAYKKVKGKIVYGKYSSVKKVKVIR